MNSEHETSKRPFWAKPLLGLIFAVFLFVGIRGYVIARLLDGYYSLGSFALDSMAAVVILFGLQFTDFALTKLLKRFVGDQTTMRQFTSKAVRLLVVVLVFGTFLLATVQMHPPKVACSKTPADFGMNYTEHTVKTADGLALSTWAIPAADLDRPVVVVTHGLGANKQNFLFVSEVFHKLNYNVVTFDFRGHGNSEGRTCTLAVREGEDVKAAYDFAKAHFPNRPIYAWSTSLGAAATLRSAAEYQIFDKLVVDASFSSVKNLALETKFCYLGPFAPFAWNISRLWFFAYVGKDIENYAPESDIARISKPIFLIHGTDDPIIPHTETYRLRAAAEPGTRVWFVEGAGHSSSFHHPDYPQRMLDFFESGANKVAVKR